MGLREPYKIFISIYKILKNKTNVDAELVEWALFMAISIFAKLTMLIHPGKVLLTNSLKTIPKVPQQLGFRKLFSFVLSKYQSEVSIMHYKESFMGLLIVSGRGDLHLCHLLRLAKKKVTLL